MNKKYKQNKNLNQENYTEQKNPKKNLKMNNKNMNKFRNNILQES